MKRAVAGLFVCLLAGCQSPASTMTETREPSRPSVPTLSEGELRSFISGKGLRYNYYGAVSTFFADGRYSYRDYEVRDAGTYAITGNTVCIQFNDGGRRCDAYALIGSDYYRIEEGGRQTKVDGIGPA